MSRQGRTVAAPAEMLDQMQAGRSLGEQQRGQSQNNDRTLVGSNQGLHLDRWRRS